MTPLLHSIAEAAKMLGIGRSKTYELIEEGRLETVYIGARRLVKADSIKSIVDRPTDSQNPDQ